MIIYSYRLTIDKLWPNFLPFIDGTTKALIFQYEEDTTAYTIFALDQYIFYQCFIFKAGEEPVGWTAQQIADNTTYRTDFETNWLSLANAQIIAKFTDPGGQGGPGTQKGQITGRVATSAVTQVPIRATTYTEPAVAAQRALVSNNVNDAAGGTGARLVRIVYLDGQMKGPFIEDVILNGTTPVNTVATNIRFIEKLEVITSGSNGANIGIITLQNVGGAPVHGTIAAGDNSSLWAHHYVPVGRSANMRCISGAVRGALGGLITARYKNPIAVIPVIERQVGIPIRIASNAGETVREYHALQSLKGPGRIVLYVTPEGATAVTFFGAFEFNDEIA
jgi:hypothetical protein